MDELVAADIDAHMGGGIAVVLEEYQIAGLQIAAGDLGAVAELAGGTVGSLMPTWAKTYMVKPEQSKPLAEEPP